MKKTIKRVMFTGDSVTDCGRARPVGDGVGALGDSYVARLFTDTWADDPETNIRYFNSATSGNTSSQLLTRYDSDVLAYSPDYVFIMIGINDCWRNFDNPLITENQVTAEQTAENVEAMIKKTVAAGAVPVLISPFFADLNRADKMREKCDDINRRLRVLAGKYSIGYIDVQSVIDKYLEKATCFLIAGDRVHPTAIGKALISRYIYKQPEFRAIFD